METFIPKITLLLFYFALSCIAPSSGYSSGAPSASCDDLTPKHKAPKQSTPSPYQVLLDRATVHLKTPLSINLTSKNGEDDFKGFVVQVRKINSEQNTGKPFEGGVFESNPDDKDARPLACSGKPNLAMTHKAAEPKKEVIVRWTPTSVGQYRVHTTFVKNYSTFWANEIDNQIIDVIPANNEEGASPTEDLASLCSTMKLDPSLEPVMESESPYLLMVGPVSPTGHEGDAHKIYQKERMWINVTSDLGTPIQKLFIQVRPTSSDSKAVGKFIKVSNSEQDGDFRILNCFDGKENGILFTNDGKIGISDVKIMWEATEDLLGDFKVVGTLLKDEETFWDKIVTDPEAGKIKVVKKSSKNSMSKGEKGTGSASSSSSPTVFLSVISTIITRTGSFLLIVGAIKHIFLLGVAMIVAH